MKRIILLLVLPVVILSCVTPAERFSRQVSRQMIETDRDDLIGGIRGFDAPDFKDDSPVWRVSVDEGCVTIEIRGRFEDRGSPYRYSIKEHYLIDIPSKGYYHFCPDTVSVYNASGGLLITVPPYGEL